MFTKAIALIAILATAASAQHFFTYQGTLEDAGAPANGNYDMRFTLWDDATIGAPDTQISSTVTSPFTAVTNGLFSVNIDLDDAAFQSLQTLYLQIEVRLLGDPTYTTLSRQRINYTPRAMYAIEAGAAQGLKFPFTASGGDSDLSPSNVLFRINNFGTTGTAIRGDGKTTGVLGLVANFTAIPPVPNGTGVAGLSNLTGVFGGSRSGNGVEGISLENTGGFFQTQSTFTSRYAVWGQSTRGSTAGFFELNDTTGLGLPALIGTTNSTDANTSAIKGIIESINPGSFSAAVRGQNNGTGQLGVGVWGSHDGAGWGIYGTSVSGFAGRFEGDVSVIGTLSKSGGSFKIDHPQDPENMTLSHSFVESPDMKNIYDGVVILNKHGQALVTLPSYFNALNQDFRYQLTTIGAYAPVFILSKIESSQDANSFIIAGGSPNLEVSWMVTGIRHDAWANKNRIPIEEFKSESEKGKYLNPKAFGQPTEQGIGYQTQD